MTAKPLPGRGAMPVKTRLALIFLGLALVFGAGVLGVTYLIVAHVLPHRAPPALERFMHPGPAQGPAPSAANLRHLIGPALQQSQGLMLEHLLIGSAIALLLLGIVVALVSSRIANRALAPLRTITDTARTLSYQNLGARIALDGPEDELKELADTFDGMLARLEQSFRDQRQFVANASHELRTPLAISRSLLEVAQQDPQQTVELWQETAHRLLEQNLRMERLIASLLVLARGEQGAVARTATDIEELLEDAMSRLPETGLRLRTRLRPAKLAADRTLLMQLCQNLLENASRYNQGGGFISIVTGSAKDSVFLRVSNSGPRIAEESLPSLLLPFHRLAEPRTDSLHGSGLGLAICDAVVKAHGGQIALHARRAGGLSVTVRLPRGEQPTSEGGAA